MLLTPLVVQAVERRIRISHGAAAIAALGTVAFFIAALFPTLSVYVLERCCVRGRLSQQVSLLLVICVYQDNYPAAQRAATYFRGRR
ncbi:MAG: hypothetical protein U0X20_11360 [Caldilineaceae bacterium]